MRISDWSSDVCSSDLRRSCLASLLRGREGSRVLRPEEHAELKAFGNPLGAQDEHGGNIAGTDLPGSLPQQPKPEIEVLRAHALPAQVRRHRTSLVATAHKRPRRPEHEIGRAND